MIFELLHKNSQYNNFIQICLVHFIEDRVFKTNKQMYSNNILQEQFFPVVAMQRQANKRTVT